MCGSVGALFLILLLTILVITTLKCTSEHCSERVSKSDDSGKLVGTKLVFFYWQLHLTSHIKDTKRTVWHEGEWGVRYFHSSTTTREANTRECFNEYKYLLWYNAGLNIVITNSQYNIIQHLLLSNLMILCLSSTHGSLSTLGIVVFKWKLNWFTHAQL